MNVKKYSRTGAATLVMAASLTAALAASAPRVAFGASAGPTTPSGTPPPPATAPAATRGDVPADQIKIDIAIRTHFENGEPIGDFLTALAVRFGMMVIQSKPTDAYILRSFDLPPTVGEALAVARQTLEPQGYSIVQKVSDQRLVIRIVPTSEFKKIQLSETPVSFGTQGEAVDISDPSRLVTHFFPITHADLTATLRRSVTQDADVSAEIMGGNAIATNLVLTGPALKVQRAVEILAKLDGKTEQPLVARTLALQHLDAQSMAEALNEVFAHDPAPMKAVADRRTNSIVVTGPEDRVLEVMVGLVSQEAKRGRVLPARGTTVPSVPPLPTEPAAPAPVPAEKPGARGASIPGLDEIAKSGDNVTPKVVPGTGPLTGFSLFVNKDAIL
jgi:hypothetical protein